jgi:Ion transport protein
MVGCLTAIVAVAVFALPAGIIGNGFEQVISKRRKEQLQLAAAAAGSSGEEENDNDVIVEEGGMTTGFVAAESTRRGRWYNFLHAQTSPTARAFDSFINVLVILTAMSFMLDTLNDEITGPLWRHAIWDIIELLAVCIFTVEYVFRVYAAAEDPKYSGGSGRIRYMYTFLALVDLLSFVPYWLQVAMTGQVIQSASFTSTTAIYLVKSLRLLRILRFEKYTHAFTSFDDVIRRNADVLSVTAFSAILIWVFFAAWLYFTERDNPDEEMASNYSTVPNAMWLTLLNLSGESPLSEYSMAGKVATGLLGLCATGIFGIPIGVLGAGFEEVVEQENEDDTRELEIGNDDPDAQDATTQPLLGAPRGLQQQQESPSSLVTRAYNFVNGIGSTASTWFELTMYFFIFLAVAVGVWQTMDGHENDFSRVEGLAVGVFTFEYFIRLVGAGADPIACFKADGTRRNPVMSRLRFMVSFYSIVDLLAIVPFYAALALPNSIVNKYDEYLRMCRIIRLVKLDKYVPSLTLIDDVIRLKFKTLRVAFYAAMTLWILFTAALFLCEHKDYDNDVDPLPLYGCVEDCSMGDRFQNFFDSMVYTGIHLTGDCKYISR